MGGLCSAGKRAGELAEQVHSHIFRGSCKCIRGIIFTLQPAIHPPLKFTYDGPTPHKKRQTCAGQGSSENLYWLQKLRSS